MDEALAPYFDEQAMRSRALRIPEIWLRRNIRVDLRNKEWNRIPFMKHRGADWVCNHFSKLAPGMEWDKVFKFCFVRHPFERLQSIYRFHVQKMTKRYPEALAAGSFENWLEMGGTGSARRSMRSFVLDSKGNLLVDYIGRYERLEQDWQYVLAHLGLEQLQLPHNEETRTRQSGSDAGLSANARRIFMANPKWAGDLEYFDYRLEQ